MKRLVGRLALSGALLFGGPGLVATMQQATTMQPTAMDAIAAERTVTLAVDRLKGNCPSCAFIVGRALSGVDGVVRVVDVSTANGTATVLYDGTRTDIAALTQATAAVGFPSQPVE